MGWLGRAEDRRAEVVLEGLGRRAVTSGRGLLPKRRRRRGRAGSILGRAGVPAGSRGAACLPGRELQGVAGWELHGPGATGARGASAGRAAERIGALPLANFRVGLPRRCPAVLALKAASAPTRPGRTCRARRYVLRGPNFVDRPSPSRHAARCPRPSGERDGGFAQLPEPGGPRPKPSSRRRGARPAWPHPCQSPRGPAHLRSAPFRVPLEVRLWLALCALSSGTPL